MAVRCSFPAAAPLGSSQSKVLGATQTLTLKVFPCTRIVSGENAAKLEQPSKSRHPPSTPCSRHWGVLGCVIRGVGQNIGKLRLSCTASGIPNQIAGAFIKPQVQEQSAVLFSGAAGQLSRQNDCQSKRYPFSVFLPSPEIPPFDYCARIASTSPLSGMARIAPFRVVTI